LRRPPNRDFVATLSELRRSFVSGFFTQGFKANPGLKLANAFSVIRRTTNDNFVGAILNANENVTRRWLLRTLMPVGIRRFFNNFTASLISSAPPALLA
jgi:hypothetical protein